ncbi:Ferritin-like diiron domain-containing protein [Plasmodiophora brassicae]|uniref:Ferritin-like diiron domain-containing protein n=1 Tax=Plasmodiophora brassicae TaxID=37360 RepID=A0A0G4J0E2_PLABS|nr:hypothetical protein PBRA_001795 [Plasmodiophora brassicae]SPQ93778.1 unnamed protein product [Plasmodiophora brassicae]
MLAVSRRVLARVSRARSLALMSTSSPAEIVDDDDADEEPTVSDQSLSNLRQILFEKSAAASRYAWFADRADDEGQLKAATLFRALAKSEQRHAMSAMDMIEMSTGTDTMSTESIGSTVDNLQAALASETHDTKTALPDAVDAADKAGDDEVAGLFQSMLDADLAQIDAINEVLAEEQAKVAEERHADENAQ